MVEYRRFASLLAPHLVATGSFLDPDPTRIIAKRILLTGHPFKVHKKTATIRYMFFNPGMSSRRPILSHVLTFNPRRHQVLWPRPAHDEARPRRPHPREPGHARVLQGALRRAGQPGGHGLHGALQTRVSAVVGDVDWPSGDGDDRRGGRDGGVSSCVRKTGYHPLLQRSKPLKSPMSWDNLIRCVVPMADECRLRAKGSLCH
jgi:hypothetical protein